MARYRLRFTNWPRPAIEWTDTPQPDCPDCGGKGGYQVSPYPGAEEPDDAYCDCWDPGRSWRILRVPVWVARRWLGYVPPEYSTEPPF